MQGLARALDVMEALLSADQPLGITDLASLTSMPKANVHRILKVLVERGYASQDQATSQYRPGLRWLSAGNAEAVRRDLRELARPHLVRLREISNENVHLVVYDKGDAVYVEALESPQPVVPKCAIGMRAPATCVASGRALLAFQTEHEIDRLIALGIPQYTASTVTDPAAFKQMLQDVRTSGYAINRNSWRTGVCGVAAPVRQRGGAVVASVGCCMPEARFTRAVLRTLQPTTIAIAEAISASLGYDPDEATARRKKETKPAPPPGRTRAGRQALQM